MEAQEFRCDSAEETQALAYRLGTEAAPGTVFALVGDLGAGKTTFVQGLARGWGVEEGTEVVSPTYALLNEYPGERGALIHVDFYRLDDSDSARSLGIEEQLNRPDVLAAVEWADHLEEMIPPGAVWIRFSMTDTGRLLQVSTGGAPPA